MTYTTCCRINTPVGRTPHENEEILSNNEQIRTLASSELAVMDLIWQRGEPVTAREIREELYGEQTKAQHGTVQRLLQRLEEKGFVSRDKRLNVHFFSASISRQRYAGSQLEELADKLTEGSIAPLITHLVEHNRISNGEIRRIRKILDAYKKDNTGKRSNRTGGEL